MLTGMVLSATGEIHDTVTFSYTIPQLNGDSLVLHPDSYILIHLTDGTDTQTDLYAGWGTVGALNDTEGRIYLFSSSDFRQDTVVDFVQWDDDGNLTNDDGDNLAAIAEQWADGDYVTSTLPGDTLGRDRYSSDANDADDWENTGGIHSGAPTPGAIVEKHRTLESLNMLLAHLKPPLAVLPGGLSVLERSCRLAEQYMSGPAGPLQIFVRRILVFIHFWRGHLEKTFQVGREVLALNERLGSAYALEGDVAITLGDVHIARGEYTAAERVLERLMAYTERVGLLSKQLRINGLSILGRLRWLEGRVADLRRIYAEVSASVSAHEVHWSLPILAVVQARLEMAEGRYAAARETLQQAVVLERRAPYATLFGSAQVLLAHLYLALGHPDRALAELAPLLAECEREGTPGRILLEGAAAVPVLRLAVERGVHAPFAAHLLDLLGVGVGARPVPVPDTGETLTKREVEVLRLIAQGLSNRAIAERLVIGEGTVKSHVHRVLSKLNVTSRAEAAARARELRLI